MPWPITGATHDQEQLGLFWTKVIKGLVVNNSWDLCPLDLPNDGLSIGCYQPSPKVHSKKWKCHETSSISQLHMHV